MTSTTNNAGRTQTEKTFGGAYALATLAWLISAEILSYLTEFTVPIGRAFTNLFSIGCLNACSTILTIRSNAAAIDFILTKLTVELFETLTDDS